MTPPESDNPYARQSAYGRMPQAPFRIGPLPKAAPLKPAPPPPPRPAGVLSGSAIPLTPRRAAPPPEPAPPQAEILQPSEPLVVPIAPAPRAAPGKGRWLAAGAAAAILAAAGAAFLVLGRGAPEPAPRTEAIADLPPQVPVREPAPSAPLLDKPAQTTTAPAAKAPVRARAPVEKAAPKPAPVVEAPAPEPVPVITPPPVLNLPQTAPTLRQPLDPDAPIPGRGD